MGGGVLVALVGDHPWVGERPSYKWKVTDHGSCHLALQRFDLGLESWTLVRISTFLEKLVQILLKSTDFLIEEKTRQMMFLDSIDF